MTNLSTSNYKKRKKILITGANGFIGKNLTLSLLEADNFEVIKFVRESESYLLKEYINEADFVVHLAAKNRGEKDEEFNIINVGITELICKFIKTKFIEKGLLTPILFTSSIHANKDTTYGKTKLQAEKQLIKLKNEIKNPVFIFRLPGVFGKWCKPNYNSVVATFCFNISRGIPIRIDSLEKELSLVYVDDLVKKIEKNILSKKDGPLNQDIIPLYKITLKELSDSLYKFREIDELNNIPKTGSGFIRALYSTYISYLPEEKFSYPLKKFEDKRGIFSEIIKTEDSGQFSFFTINKGSKRGCHYHHTKSEKFLIVDGKVKFTFLNILTKRKLNILADSNNLQIVNSIPGWYHDIENIGESTSLVFLWTNEVYDPKIPDTFNYNLE